MTDEPSRAPKTSEASRQGGLSVFGIFFGWVLRVLRPGFPRLDQPSIKANSGDPVTLRRSM